MKVTMIKQADRKRPPVACPWLIDCPYEKVEKPER
jgi:hypothetical protein